MKQGLQGELAHHLAAYRPGWSLPRPFYRDEALYRADLERIWRRGWLFAGHACELRSPGDYLTFAGRHRLAHRDPRRRRRGARAAQRLPPPRLAARARRGRGSASASSAPTTSGPTTATARSPPAAACRRLDKSQLGLKPVHVASSRRADLRLARRRAADVRAGARADGAVPAAAGLRARQGGEDRRLRGRAPTGSSCGRTTASATTATSTIRSTSRRTSTTTTPTTPTAEVRARDRPRRRPQRSKVGGRGAGRDPPRDRHDAVPRRRAQHLVSANRTALVEGYVSETMDGRQVAPLMGDYRDADVGTLRIRTLPNMWNHSSCDHGVSTRLLPAGPRNDAGARHLARARGRGRRPRLPARRADAVLAAHLRAGLGDLRAPAEGRRARRAYVPGPFSTYKEYNVDAFVRWYVKTLAAGASV